MTEQHPLVERYVARLDTGLGGLAPAERQEVVQEIRNHIADAIAAGKSLDAVLETLGSADMLARAYAVELMLHPRPSVSRTRLDRFLRIAGLVVIGSLPTLVVVVVLGSIGVSFVASGVTVFVVGIWARFGTLPPNIEMDGIPPEVAIALGPVLTILGGVALYGLVWYVRWVARLVSQVLPAR